MRKYHPFFLEKRAYEILFRTIHRKIQGVNQDLEICTFAIIHGIRLTLSGLVYKHSSAPATSLQHIAQQEFVSGIRGKQGST